MRYAQINHIAIYAKELVNTVEFYCQVFGFPKTEIKYHEDGRIKMIRLEVNESQSIEFMNFDKDPPKKKGEYVTSGYMHFGLSLNNVHEYAKRTRQEYSTFIASDGSTRIFIKDPEENLIELCELNEVQECSD